MIMRIVIYSEYRNDFSKIKFLQFNMIMINGTAN